MKSLLIGSEGTLGVITAVRLRLLPAPEAAIALVVFLRTRAQGCQAILDVLAAGIQPAALDFLDGDTLRIVEGGYPGVVPGGAGFALLVEVDGARAQDRGESDALEDLLAGGAVSIHEPADRAALWRWRDGVNGVVTAARGAKVSEDVAFPVERLAEGLERFEEIAARHGLERVRVWSRRRRQRARDRARRPGREAELDAAEAVGEELFALVAWLGGRSPPSTAWAC